MGKHPVPGESLSQTKQRTRRTQYVFGSTALFIAIICAVNYFGNTGPIAERTVDGAYGIIELLVIGFLFSTTVDRSEILHNIGRGVRDYGSRKPLRTGLTSGRDDADDDPAEKEKTYG
ncbi:hypothetical protein HNR26_003885 [Rhizobium rosettiformans]|uniref:Uncharacterized protein n=2 Tax=Rhizobium rosettiformans TaxID=1368430 RepID=A0A4S8PPT2_9HYPH|nr:hypothetical protein [Rhizobium rosettiformans]MBB5277796.1 hypothetical protein [Rhizobium rosettiformans]THV32957.1 hypothetical protein FAA86_18880 [Rhizobium rosettiformans W3]